MLWKYWAPVVAYGAFIFYLSSQSYPDQQLPSFIFDVSDKLLHVVEYGIFGILLYRAFKQSTRLSLSIGLAVVCVIAFGISDELHQWFVPQREADVWDLAADAFGGTFLILGWAFFTEKWRMWSFRPSD